METSKKASIIVFVLSLLFQGLNLASQGLAVKTYKDADDASGSNSNMDTNFGYYTPVLTASAISVVLYIILIVKHVSSDGPSSMVEWTCSHLAVILQFGVATVLAANLRNTVTSYESSMSLLDTYQSLGVTGAAVDLLVNYRNVHHISMAAMVIDYVICFAGGFFVVAWSENDRRNQQPKVNDEKERHEITVEQIR